MTGPPPLETLSPFERFAVRLVARMNRGNWQRTWFWCQRQIGARWIGMALGPILEVHGLENILATSRDRPLLLVSNHRSFFDLYVVMSTLSGGPGMAGDLLSGPGPVLLSDRRWALSQRGGCLVDHVSPVLLPARPGRRRFDQWALEHLVDLCREGPGRLIGFHPEGTRNKGNDPYALLPAHPGVGRLIHEARPQVVPVFINGLSNNLPEMIGRRWTGGERVRIWFGPPLPYDEFLTLPPVASTYRRIAEFVMEQIASLGASDRGRVLR